MKRFLLTAGALLLAFILGRALVHAIVSEATHVRWLVEDMVEGFNETRLDPCVRALAPGFSDEPSGADRELVKQGLIRLFFTEKDPQTKSFALAAELAPDDWRVAVRDAEPKTATLECTLRFHRRKGDELAPEWEIRVQAELAKGEDGWRIAKTRHETVSGARLK